MLQALAVAPFEFLASVSLMILTLRTPFLVAVASGRRRATIHALSADSGHIRWEKGGFRLIPHATFLAKNQKGNSAPVEIFLPEFPSLSSVPEDKLWCPVRAL